MRKWICATLAVLCCLGGCTKTEPVQTDEVLTNVYRMEPALFPEGYMVAGFRGIVDGTYCFQCHTEEYTTDENGYDAVTETEILYYIPQTGEDPWKQMVLSDTRRGISTFFNANMRTILLPVENGAAVVTKNFSNQENGQLTATLSYVWTDGTVEETEMLSSLDMKRNDIFRMRLTRDADGYFYIAGDSTLWVCDPAGNLVFQKELSSGVGYDTGGITAMTNAQDGTVWLQRWRTGLCPINRVEQTVGDALAVPAGIEPSGYFFGDGYDVYCYNAIGIYGISLETDTATLLMDFLNSDVSDDVREVVYIDEERFLIGYVGDTGSSTLEYSIFTRVGDVRLSDIPVLQVVGCGISADIMAEIVRFNREQNEVRVTVHDYNQYNNAENPYGGAYKLGSDILNKLCTPDVYLDSFDDRPYLELFTSGIFTDLYVLMKQDPTFDEGDLFACISKLYTVDGRLAAIPARIRFSTLLTSREYIGKKTQWSLDEMLDVFDQYPSGTSQSGVFWSLVKDGTYRTFLHDGFQTPSFRRLLTYVKSLPDNVPEIPFDRVTSQYAPYRNGEIAIKVYSYSAIEDWYGDWMYFGKEDTERIGYPADKDSLRVWWDDGMIHYSIFDSSMQKEEAWQFVRYMLAQDENRSYTGGFPITHTAFRKLVDDNTDLSVARYDNGCAEFTYDKRNAKEIEETIGSSGVLIRHTDVDWDGIELYIDSIGAPLCENMVPDAVSDILADEISTYLAGNGTAEEAAERIDNRVKLYLAEKGKS